MKNKTGERFFLWVANQLDKNSKYCWAELVLWAYGHYPVFAVFPFHKNYEDLTTLLCVKSKSYAWCGKCAVLGRIKDDRELPR